MLPARCRVGCGVLTAMLAFTGNQVDKILLSRRDGVVNAITDWLIEEFPTDGIDRNAVLAEVRAAATTAWNWGIESGELVRLHVFAAKVLGSDYHIAAPIIGRVLGDPALIDDAKLAWFAGWLDAFKRRAEQGS